VGDDTVRAEETAVMRTNLRRTGDVINDLREMKRHFRETVVLAAPVALSQISDMVTVIADTIMVGRVGTIPLAAATLANSVWVVGFFFTLGFTIAITPIAGAAWGRRDNIAVGHTIRAGWRVSMLAAWVMTAILTAVAFVLPWFGAPVDVTEQAFPYFLWIVASIPPRIAFGVFKQSAEAMSNTRSALVVAIIANLSNIGLNWILIYGHLGFPAMGLEGAGIATFISRLIMVALAWWIWSTSSLFHSVRPHTRVAFWRRDILRESKDIHRESDEGHLSIHRESGGGIHSDDVHRESAGGIHSDDVHRESGEGHLSTHRESGEGHLSIHRESGGGIHSDDVHRESGEGIHRESGEGIHRESGEGIHRESGDIHRESGEGHLSIHRESGGGIHSDDVHRESGGIHRESSGGIHSEDIHRESDEGQLDIHRESDGGIHRESGRGIHRESSGGIHSDDVHRESGEGIHNDDVHRESGGGIHRESGRGIHRESGDIHREMFNTGYPIAAQIVLEVLAFAGGAVMMGWLGATSLAAHQIAMNLAALTFMAALGISAAATIRTSNFLGAQKYSDVRKAGWIALYLVVAYNLVTAFLFVVLRHILPTFYSEDPTVIDLAGQLLLLAAAFQLFDGSQNVGLGALRGIGDVRIPMMIAVVCYGAINIPVSYVCAFTLGMGPQGIWFGYVAGLLFASVSYWMRFRHMSNRLLQRSVPGDEHST